MSDDKFCSLKPHSNHERGCPPRFVAIASEWSNKKRTNGGVPQVTAVENRLVAYQTIDWNGIGMVFFYFFVLVPPSSWNHDRKAD